MFLRESTTGLDGCEGNKTNCKYQKGCKGARAGVVQRGAHILWSPKGTAYLEFPAKH